MPFTTHLRRSVEIPFHGEPRQIDSQTINGQAGDNQPFNWYTGGWFATAGSHTVTVTVDPGTPWPRPVTATIRRRSPSRRCSRRPCRRSCHCRSAASRSRAGAWSTDIDVNPLPGVANDYEGGPFVYDGHDGYDFVLPTFAAMDAGMPVFAAAAGTITDVQDGNFDRETAFGQDQPNDVTEDLGSGWEAEYLHFMMNSITVQVGQTVQAGQLLGYAGSSGDSTMAHLHFDLRHDGDLVETFDEPSTYWVNPLPYQGDVPPSITGLGVSNSRRLRQTARSRPEAVIGRHRRFFRTGCRAHCAARIASSLFAAPVPGGADLLAPARRHAGDVVSIQPDDRSRRRILQLVPFLSVWEALSGDLAGGDSDQRLGNRANEFRSDYNWCRRPNDQDVPRKYLSLERPYNADRLRHGGSSPALRPELSFQIENIGSTTLSTSASTCRRASH